MTTSLADSPLAPTYDRSAITTGIVHFGVGGFHRAHHAMYVDRLMREGKALDWGICGVGLLPADAVMRDALTSQDTLYSLTLKHPTAIWSPRSSAPSTAISTPPKPATRCSTRSPRRPRASSP